MRKTILLLIALLPVLCFAQKGNYIGVNASGGSTGIWFDDSFTEMGVDVENQFSKHCGVGIGMSLARFNNDTYLASMDYLRVPIYCTLHTGLVDISPIFKMNFLQNRTFSPTIIWTDFAAYYPNFFVEFGVALSKDFLLRRNLYLVTKAQASLALEVDEMFSFGLGLKRRFN